MLKLDLEKAEEPEIKLPTSIGSSKKQKSSRKTSISALLTMPKPLTVWITTNCEKLFKRRSEEHTSELQSPPRSTLFPYTTLFRSKKQKSSRKTSISALLTMPKPLTVWITTNCEKLFKR